MDNTMIAELIEWQTRTTDLQNAVERLTQQRDAARSSVDLLMHENAALQEMLDKALATVDRLRLHIQQGIEL